MERRAQKRRSIWRFAVCHEQPLRGVTMRINIKEASQSGTKIASNVAHGWELGSCRRLKYRNVCLVTVLKAFSKHTRSPCRLLQR